MSISLRLPEALRPQLAILAAAERRSLSAQVAVILEAAFTADDPTDEVSA